MPLTNPELWHRLQGQTLPFHAVFDRELSPRRLTANFAEYLSYEGTWTLQAARQIEEEYRRFLYLKVIDGGTLTPPKSVDMAWHLHMRFGLDYLQFWKDIGCTEIRHSEDLGAKARDAAYDRVIALYRAEFGVPPPEVWPQYRNLRMVLRHNSLLSYPWVVVVWLPLLALLAVFVVQGRIGYGPFLTVALTSFLVTLVHVDRWVTGPEKIANCG